MPPKTRSTKIIKASKENVPLANRNKSKPSEHVKKVPRKALADKTNSASDDNTTLPSKKLSLTKADSNNKKQNIDEESPKQRRVRRVPVRYIGNPILTNLSNSNNDVSLLQDSTPKKKVVEKKKAVAKNSSPLSSPTALKSGDNSILKSRPKRICRLPSKLEGHSISPNKYIPLQPVHASTPIANKGSKLSKSNVSLDKTPPVPSVAKKQSQKRLIKNKGKSSDANNNGKKQLQIDKCFEKQKTLENNTKLKSKKVVNANSSFRVFDDIKKSLKRDSSKLDPYEFTFDPDEEPPPQKKKKKKVVKKNPTKSKPVVKGIYEKNLAKALATLKNTVKSKEPRKDVEINTVKTPQTKPIQNEKNNVTNKINTVVNKSVPCENNYHSVRVEDIALDLQDNSHVDDGHNIDYSPVNSPQPPPKIIVTEQAEVPANHKDPLNLQEDLSFFDDQPVASSSMNMSVRHPLASPWRVEFGSLPIKWQANTYVKPNMTPAVESSFINSSDVKKKHIYTNMVPDTNETLEKIVDQPSYKQTSILSFIKEVAERSAKKKKKSTPVKANSLFEDITHTSLNVSPLKHTSENSKNSEQSNLSNNSEKSNENVLEKSKTPSKSKSPRKRMTYFGFDESEEQENVSPCKKDKRVKALVPRSRAVLQEINSMKGPSRAVIPVSVKSVLNSDNLNKNYEDPKSAMEPPVFPEKVTTRSNAETDVNTNVMDDDSQSVHLFEDMDLIHHYHQPPRKSYGKAKKVAFRQNSATDSDAPSDAGEQASSADEDNLEDLSFKLPQEKTKRKKKKMTKKQILSKKEEKEVETWAAGFNSMCEDIEEFDLVVE